MKNTEQDSGYSLEEAIELKEYWFIFRQNLMWILGFTIIATTIAAIGIFSMPRMYQSSSTLFIEADEHKIGSMESVSVTGGVKSIYFATQFELLKSREFTQKVIVRNRKAFREEFQKEQVKRADKSFRLFTFKKDADDTNYFPRGFFGQVTVTPIKGTQLVKITYESSDPRFAAVIADGLADAYIENNLEVRTQMAQESATALAEKSDHLKAKLIESEQQLQAYRESEGLVDGISRTGKTLAITDMEASASKLAEAKQRRIQAENVAAMVNQQQNQSIEVLATIPAVLQNNLVQRLKEQEAAAQQKLSELQNRYGDKHPKIIAAQSELAAAKQNVADQIVKVVEGINKEAEIARATEKELDYQMTASKNKTQAVKRKEYKLDQLEREVATNRQLYDSNQARLKEIAEGGDMLVPNARIVDHAVVATHPYKPARIMLGAEALVFSFVLAIFIAFIKEASNSTVRSKEDVLLKLHVQLLGILPLLKQKNTSEPSREYTTVASGSFAESVRTIRTGVVLSGLDLPHKSLLVTSSIPDEGKTTVSSNLAAAFGQMGKTLLIDADMRRPSIAKIFGIGSAAPGLSDLVAETSELKECIHHIDALGIDVLTAGTLPPNPLELLSSRRFAAVLVSLEKQYDRIIIDSSPCEVVSDALILSTHVSAVIYVVKADVTNIKVVKSGISRLQDANASITGVVLNQVNIDKRSRDGSYGHYYGGYYDYYGYSKPVPGEK